MKQDIRKGIKSSFLYKRFAYNSEGFIELMKFLKNENIIEDFCKYFTKSGFYTTPTQSPLQTIYFILFLANHQNDSARFSLYTN